jgi:hypothetical protein
MKTIGIAVVSLVIAVLSCANAGDLPGLAPIEAEYHVGPFALDANRPVPHDANFLSFESGDPIRLQLNGWSPAGANSDSPSESAVALYLKYGPLRDQSIFSRAKVAAISSHVSAISAPIVRSIDVEYPGARARSKQKILARMRTRVGRRYSERIVEEDIRNLSGIEGIARVRIFGEPFADGVKIIVALQPKSTLGHEYFDFNIGYQF